MNSNKFLLGAALAAVIGSSAPAYAGLLGGGAGAGGGLGGMAMGGCIRKRFGRRLGGAVAQFAIATG
jgi:hypothetical protein